MGSLQVGGAETQLLRLAAGLDPQRFQLGIVTWSGGGELAAQAPPGVPVEDMGLRRLRLTSVLRRPAVAARIVAGLSRRLRSQRPDILHAYMFAAYVLGSYAAGISRVPSVVAGRRGLVSYRDYPPPAGAAGRLANRLIDLHVCNSEAVRTWALQHEPDLDAARTVVVHNGVEVSSGGGAGRGAPGSGRPRAAVIANLHAYKGHRVLIDALRVVADRHPELGVTLFGDGPERERLQRQVSRLGLERTVVFAGAQPDAARRVSEFDLTVLPSFEEGFPNAILESLAAGVPVAATAVGGVPELVRDGIEGRLCPPRDPAALAESISWLIENPTERARMGAAGRSRAALFSTASMVRATAELYERLLASPSGPWSRRG